MSLLRAIAHNTLIQTATKVVSIILALIAFGMMTRYLGQEGFGDYTAINAFLQIFSIMADLGLTIIAIQMISEVGHDHVKNFNNIFTLRLISATILMSVGPLIALFFPFSIAVKLGMIILAGSFIFNSIISLLTVIFQVHLKMVLPLYAELAGRCALIGGIALAMHLHWGLLPILAIITLNNLIPSALLLFWARGIIPISLAFDWPLWREIMHRTWPIALSIILNLLYLRMDSVILSLTHSAADVGLYGAAYRVIDTLNTFPFMFMGIMLATFSRSWSAHERETFHTHYQAAFDCLVVALLPILITTLFHAESIITLLAGSSFAPAGPILQILILSVAIVFLSCLFTNLINVVHEQRRMIWGFLAGALIGLPGYALLIPSFSYWAAAWVTVCSEGLILIISFVLLTKKIKMLPNGVRSCKALIASAGMILFFLFTPHMPFLLSIPLSLLVYTLLLFVTGVVSRGLLQEIFSIQPSNTR